MIACRGRDNLTAGRSIEDLIRGFLHESFNSSFMYIISPWVTNFEFSRPFIHYPWVSSTRVLDVIEAIINKGVEVKVLTRCFDDALRFDVLDLAGKIVNRGSVDDEVKGFIKSQLEDLLGGIEAMLRLSEVLGDNLLFDLGIGDLGRRLHTKLYINDKHALVGSANFTKSGIIDSSNWANWECLIAIKSSETGYGELLNITKGYLNAARGFSECEGRFMNMLSRFRGLLPRAVGSVMDVIAVLEDLINTLS